MPGRLIEHIGILVPDLEAAIAKWSAVTGYTFSPIRRYRTRRWVDSSNPEPHDHDARISFSKEGPPRIELMEFTGAGVLSASEAGVHHFGIYGVEDPEARLAELAALGVGDDGRSLHEDGRMLLFFTDKADLDGVRFEYIGLIPGPIVADDGSALQRDPVTGRADIWGPPA